MSMVAGNPNGPVAKAIIRIRLFVRLAYIKRDVCETMVNVESGLYIVQELRRSFARVSVYGSPPLVHFDDMVR